MSSVGSTGHTPGPWHVEVSPFGPVCKVTGNVDSDGLGDDIATVTTRFAAGGRVISESEWRANAALMAMAPVLLSALTRLADAYDELLEVHYDAKPRSLTLEMARAAIRKATEVR